MKIKNGFMLRKVADQNVVVAIGEASRILNGLMKLNDTGVFLWNLLLEGSDKENLIEKLQEEYDVVQETAEKDVTEFLKILENVGCLE